MDKGTKRILKTITIIIPILLLSLFLISSLIIIPVSAEDDVEVPESPIIDGVIGEDEYEFSVEFSSGIYELHWTVIGDNISIGLKGKTGGWIAFGIEPTLLMKDSDIIFCWVDSHGEAGMIDCYSTGATGPHPADMELGGTHDIVDFAGSEESGWTSIEFTRTLSTADKYDKAIKLNEGIKIIWALGSSDDHTDKHIERGGAIVDFSEGDVIESVPWYYHATWMISGLVLMLSGIIVIKFMKTKPWRIKVHKTLLILGGASSILGIVSGIYMVTMSGGGHFKVVHAYVGIVTIILILVTLRYGFDMFKQPPEKIQQFKKIHKMCGRITATFMIINIVLGLSLVGIV